MRRFSGVHGFYMATRVPLVIAIVALFPACSDRLLPTQIAADLDPSLAQTATAPRAGFTFLAPLAQPTSLDGEFNPSLPVSVDVCNGTAPCTLASRIAEFTTKSGPGAETIRVDQDGQSYIVNWNTQKFNISTNTVYRVHVRVGDVVLGNADVLLVSNAKELRGVRPNQVGLVKGQTLPIRFRINKGVIDAEVMGSSGGTVASSDGTVSLAFPAGALNGETTIVVEPLSAITDTRVIGGTAFHFGPSGTQFAEPVTISIKYDPAVLPVGVSPSALRIHRLVNGAWQLVPGGTVNTQTRTVSAPTLHFSTYAVLPAGFAGFTTVDAGEHHACALTSRGQVWCWGENHSGQLGNGTTTSSSIPVEVQGGLEFQSLQAGASYTCGVTTAGVGYCWGANGSGQLGNGTTTSSSTPTRVNSTQSFASVEAGGHQTTCGLTTTGEVYCWGLNWGDVLRGATAETCTVDSEARPCSTTPFRVSLPAVADLDVGLAHACARTSGGEAYCWGWNAGGQIGADKELSDLSWESVTRVPGKPYSSISAGAWHTCAIDGSGNASCWGSGFGSGVGDGTDLDHYSPTAVAGGLRFKQIDAGDAFTFRPHSCGVTTTGEVYCWGYNDEGKLGVMRAPYECLGIGTDKYNCALAPIRIDSSLSFNNVSTGGSYACGSTTGGDVYCWGRGPMGNGATQSYTPVRVKTPQ